MAYQSTGRGATQTDAIHAAFRQLDAGYVLERSADGTTTSSGGASADTEIRYHVNDFDGDGVAPRLIYGLVAVPGASMTVAMRQLTDDGTLVDWQTSSAEDLDPIDVSNLPLMSDGATAYYEFTAVTDLDPFVQVLLAGL